MLLTVTKQITETVSIKLPVFLRGRDAHYMICENGYVYVAKNTIYAVGKDSCLFESNCREAMQLGEECPRQEFENAFTRASAGIAALIERLVPDDQLALSFPQL